MNVVYDDDFHGQSHRFMSFQFALFESGAIIVQATKRKSFIELLMNISIATFSLNHTQLRTNISIPCELIEFIV